MPRVKFLFDKDRDLWNIYDKSTKGPTFGTFKVDPKIKEICNGKTLSKCKKELAEYRKPVHDCKMINLQIEVLQKFWNPIEKEFFKRMDRLMKKNFKRNIKAYITTIRICPYNTGEPSFMVSLFSPLLDCINTCGHEIMHLYFHEFYWKATEKRIGEKKTGDLKEALTVLLNLEFNDLWHSYDLGYPEHKELRDFISQEWKKEKDFDKLLEKCIEKIIKTPSTLT